MLLTPSHILVAALIAVAQAMVDPCQINNVSVWVRNRPVVTKFNCNQSVKINATDLKDSPDVQLTGSFNMGDRFTLMMLKLIPNVPGKFNVFWFVANIPPDRDFFLTKNISYASQYLIYQRPTVGDYQILVFKQNNSGPAPHGPGFTNDSFSVNIWMDKNAGAVDSLVGGAKFQVVNDTVGLNQSPHPYQQLPVPMSPIPYPSSYNPNPLQPPPVNPYYAHPQPVPPYGNHPINSQPTPQNTSYVVHHLHQHEVVKKKKNSAPSISVSLFLFALSSITFCL